MMLEDPTKVEDLKTYTRRANLKVKIVSKPEPKSVISRRYGTSHEVAEALVGDETGCILLNLWNEDIDRFNVGDVIQIRNGYVRLFRGSMRLNIGKYGEAAKLMEEMAEVNTENNLSERRYPERWRQSREL
jgi:replication factor A1